MHLLTDSLCTATLMLVHGTSAEHSVKLTTPAEGAPRLQACINAVELAIIANSIALDTVLKAACTARVPYSPQWWWCLEKNYWADSECALNVVATAVIFHIDHVSPPVSPFIRFSPPSLRPGVVGVCFEVPGWMLCLNGCSLWSRGSWLGGSLVSALSFVASITLLPGPFVWFRVFFVLLLVRWPFSMTHKMSSCMLFPLLVAIPLLCVFCLFWFGCGCVFLVCLVSFVSGFGFLVLAGTARWTVYRSTTSTLVAIDKLTALHDNYNSSFCCDWTCVTTWRKPWRRWTEKKRMAGRINSGSISIAWYILSPGSTRMVTSPGRRLRVGRAPCSYAGRAHLWKLGCRFW